MVESDNYIKVAIFVTQTNDFFVYIAIYIVVTKKSFFVIYMCVYIYCYNKKSHFSESQKWPF